MVRCALLILLCCAGTAAAQSPTSRDLRSYFEGLDAGAPAVVAGQTLLEGATLAAFYRSRDHAPVWTDGGPLADQLGALLDAIRRSEAHGLNPARYHQAALLERMQPPPKDAGHPAAPDAGHARAAADLALELLASDAFLLQARHRSAGAVAPKRLDPEWFLVKPDTDPAVALQRTLSGPTSVADVLDSLWPHSAEYRELVAHRARILALGDVQSVQVPPGPLLRPGSSDVRVVLLKTRLLGPGDHSPHFDQDLRAAVLEFQRSAGLETDGLVGNATLEVMNASRFSWVDRIDANLERWRWLPADEPDTYVRVNIASFSLRVISHGEDVLRMGVIVGRPYRRTPIFSEPIRYMVFNPYWNVPYKLAVQDKLPLLKENPAELDAQGYEVRPEGAGGFLPVSAMDWSGVTRRNFRHLLRQRPGTHNALGRVKFMLPNSHAVYLHDTPGRELFAKQERSFSSGCVRLSEPLELARWILNHDGRPGDAARVAELAAGDQTTTIYLRKPLPTYLVYFTAFTDDAGDVVFRRDLYQRDSAIVAALRATVST